MQDNLVIVESPAKAKTIEKFLGKDYKVMSSYGHIRDLKKKELSIGKDTLTSAGTCAKCLALTRQRRHALFSMRLPNPPYYRQ